MTHETTIEADRLIARTILLLAVADQIPQAQRPVFENVMFQTLAMDAEAEAEPVECMLSRALAAFVVGALEADCAEWPSFADPVRREKFAESVASALVDTLPALLPWAGDIAALIIRGGRRDA